MEIVVLPDCYNSHYYANVAIVYGINSKNLSCSKALVDVELLCLQVPIVCDVEGSANSFGITRLELSLLFLKSTEAQRFK